MQSMLTMDCDKELTLQAWLENVYQENAKELFECNFRGRISCYTCIETLFSQFNAFNKCNLGYYFRNYRYY